MQTLKVEKTYAWIGRNSFFSKPGCRDYFCRAGTGSAEISSSRSRAAEIIFSEPGLDRQKFLLIEAGLQRFFFRAGTGSAEIPSSRRYTRVLLKMGASRA
jgi:hypothetical protein